MDDSPPQAPAGAPPRSLGITRPWPRVGVMRDVEGGRGRLAPRGEQPVVRPWPWLHRTSTLLAVSSVLAVVLVVDVALVALGWGVRAGGGPSWAVGAGGAWLPGAASARLVALVLAGASLVAALVVGASPSPWLGLARDPRVVLLRGRPRSGVRPVSSAPVEGGDEHEHVLRAARSLVADAWWPAPALFFVAGTALRAVVSPDALDHAVVSALLAAFAVATAAAVRRAALGAAVLRRERVPAGG